jgi:hypothetical protein
MSAEVLTPESMACAGSGFVDIDARAAPVERLQLVVAARLDERFEGGECGPDCSCAFTDGFAQRDAESANLRICCARSWP